MSDLEQRSNRTPDYGDEVINGHMKMANRFAQSQEWGSAKWELQRVAGQLSRLQEESEAGFKGADSSRLLEILDSEGFDGMVFREFVLELNNILDSADS